MHVKKRISHAVLALTLVLSFVFNAVPAWAGASAFDDTWNWANPLPQGNDLKAVAYGGGRYAAVGESGAVVTSTDNVTWTRASSDFYSGYNTVAYGNGLFVAGGNWGQVGTSADGISWTYSNSATSEDILGITFGEGLFVAVGDNFIMTSPDGLNWTALDVGSVFSGTVHGVTYGNGYFVAVGGNGTILYSGNGTTWNPDTSGTTEKLSAVTYGDNIYIAVGRNGTILTSAAPGSGSWQTISYGRTDDLRSVAYGNGLYVITSDYMYLTSSNRTDWTVTLDANGLAALNGVVWGGGGFAAVGAGGLIIKIDGGSSWTGRSSGSKSYLAGMTYNNGLFVAVGTNEIMTSLNGVQWTRQSAPGDVGTLEAVAGNGSGGYAAVGYGYDAGHRYIGTLVYSTDGTTWQKAATALGTDMMLKGVAYGNGQYVAVGSSWSSGTTGVIYTSEDGSVWSQIDTGGVIGRLTDVTYGNGIFVTVGEDDTLMISPNGTSWVPMSRTKTINLNNINYTGIAYGGELFVAVGNNGEIVKSSDSEVWSDMEKYSGSLSGITYGSGYFVSAGQSGLILRCAVSGGVADTWERTGQYMTTNRLNAAAYGNGVYAVAGDNGTILYSGSAAAAPTTSNATNNSVSVSPASITVGGSTTITATGDRQSVTGEIYGDERYIPTEWTSTEAGKNGTFTLSEGNYTSSYTPASADSYTITATFRKQTWDGSAWIDAEGEGSTDTKTVPVTVNSSGGGSGGGATSSVLTASVEATDFNKSVPVAVDGTSGSVKANVGENTLVEAFGKGNADSSGIKIVTVFMPVVKEVQSYDLTLPADILSSQTAGKAIKINTAIATVTVPGNMLNTADAAGAQNVLLTIAAGDKSKLDAAVQAQIGDRPVIELNLKVDGKQTAWNNDSAPVTVTVPYAPTAEELANPESIVIWYIDGSGKAISVPNGRYDPSTGAVTFTTTHFSYYAVSYNKVNFKDVAASAWYSKAVGFIAARGITTGTGNGNYSPEAKLTRGEFLVMMMRAYGIAPDTNPKNNFSDAGNTYYTGYLAAAKRLGISTGVGNNMFAPGKEITRQEMFTLLCNALKTIGSLPQGNSGKSLSSFSDAGQIESWAKEAMALLVETGTIGGNAGKLSPTSTATRAEMAQVIYNLFSK